MPKPGTANTLLMTNSSTPINFSAYKPVAAAPTTTFSSGLTNIAAPKPVATAAPAPTPTTPTFGFPQAAPASSTIAKPTQTTTQSTISGSPYGLNGQQAAPANATAPLPSPVPQNQTAPVASANLGGSYFNAANQSAPPQVQQNQGAFSGGLDANGNPIPTLDQNGKPLSGGTGSGGPAYSQNSLIGQSPNFSNYVQGEAGAAAGAIPIGQNATAIAKQYQDLINPMLGEQVGERTTGTYPVGEGNAAAIGQEIQGLSAQEGQALTANAQGLTAQQQASQGLGNAAGQISPQLGPTGTQAYYNPLTQSQTSGGNTPFSGGQAQGDVDLGVQYAKNVSVFNQARAIKTNIQSTLAQNPSLNPSVFSDVNTALQFLNGKVSNPQYQTLSNNISEYVSTLAPILGVGGDTTNFKTQIAQGFVNAAASGQSISQVLDGIEQLAQAKLNAQKGGSGSTGGSTGGTPSANDPLGIR